MSALWTPAEQDTAPHSVLEGQSSQAPALHLPSVPQVDSVVVTHTARGSALPSIAGPQTPSVPPVFAAEHAWQALSHAASQHTPSMQNPLWQSAPVAHAAP